MPAPLLRRPTLHDTATPFFNFPDSPLRGSKLKFTFPPFKKGWSELWKIMGGSHYENPNDLQTLHPDFSEERKEEKLAGHVGVFLPKSII